MEDVITFLNKILVNNNRPWFQENKNLYLKAQDKQSYNKRLHI